MWRHFGGLDHHRIHLLYVACDMDTLKHSVRKDNFVSVDIISICAWRNRYICQSAKRQKLIKIEDLEVRPHFAVLSGATGDKVQVSRIDSKTLPYKRKWRVMSNDMHLAHVNVIFWLSRAFHSVEPKMDDDAVRQPSEGLENLRYFAVSPSTRIGFLMGFGMNG